MSGTILDLWYAKPLHELSSRRGCSFTKESGVAEVSFLTHSFTCLELLVYVVVVFRYSYLGR